MEMMSTRRATGKWLSPAGQAAQGRDAPGEMEGWCHHLADEASSAPPCQMKNIWHLLQRCFVCWPPHSNKGHCSVDDHKCRFLPGKGLEVHQPLSSSSKPPDYLSLFKVLSWRRITSGGFLTVFEVLPSLSSSWLLSDLANIATFFLTQLM